MTELYSGSTTAFVELTTQNRIAETLRAAFVDDQGFEPPRSEVLSWRASLRALAGAVERAGLDDHGILLEYRLPLSSLRLDALLTGLDPWQRPKAVIVELKQWDDALVSDVPECVGVRYGSRIKDVLHPSAQARQYRDYLADSHSAFTVADAEADALGLSACAFLHDLRDDASSELFADRHRHLLDAFPLFPGERVDDLAAWLEERLGGGHGLALLPRVREGRYAPHKRLLDHTAAMIRQEPAYVLLDEQMVVYNDIVATVERCVEAGQKAAFVIRGGPGTGKSVLALNLVADLSAAGRATHHATGSSAFTQTVRRIVGRRAAQQFTYFNSYLNAEPDTLDVVVCDEAHRIRRHSWNRFTKKQAADPDRPQIDELLAVATVSVFFIDDLQAVRRDEIGTANDIVAGARARHLEVREHDLPIQFRCGGSDGFVRWVEQTLEIRRTANKLWAGDPDFDFDIVDSPDELEALVRARHGEGHSARLVAGYCWPWSHPDEDGTLVADVAIGGWAMPWNARPDAGRLATGIPKSQLWAHEAGGIDQVGCIYTAQGFEFDYVGVIWGPDLVYRPRQGWVGRPERSFDGGLTRGTDPETFTELVKNAYRVLLSRGLKGCYVHFRDEATRDFVESRIDWTAVRERAREAALEEAAEEEPPYDS